MALTCGAKCAKFLLVVFNLLFWLSGCGLLGYGIYSLVEKERTLLFALFTTYPEGSTYAPSQCLAWAIVGIGGVIFLVGFCGCCGAIRENRCLLVTYFIFLFIIMSTELAVGILSVIFQDKTIGTIEDLPSVLQEEYGIDTVKTEAFDFAQTKFKCCGITGPEDYDESNWKKQDLGKGNQVAKTCCVLTNDDHLDPKPLNSTMCQSIKPAENAAFRHNEGCDEHLREFIKFTSLIFVGIGCSLAVLEIFGMVCAMCLCKEV